MGDTVRNLEDGSASKLSDADREQSPTARGAAPRIQRLRPLDAGLRRR